MKLLGTVAHSRGTVVRLSCRMVPSSKPRELQSSCSMAHGSLVEPSSDRFALWHKEELPNPATLLLLLQNAFSFRAKTV